MCRAGGPRCNGGGRKANATTTTQATATTMTVDAQDNAAARSGDSVPTRELADQLAAALSPDRTDWSGQPLDATGRRMYALRESGYNGPIDQDGYPDTTSEAAGILRRMATDRGETVDW